MIEFPKRLSKSQVKIALRAYFMQAPGVKPGVKSGR